MMSTDNTAAQVRDLLAHQDNVMPSASVSDISCEMSDHFPFVDSGQGERECKLPDDWYDDHHPDYNYDDEEGVGDDLDEYSGDGVGDPSEYIAMQYRNRDELLVAELESQLNLQHSQRTSMHETKMVDTSFFR